MRRFTLHGDVDKRYVDCKGDNAYQIDVTSYVSVKSRCTALEQATGNLAQFRADRYGREIQHTFDSQGNEVFDSESIALMNNDRGYNSTDVLYPDKMDTSDLIQERTEEIEKTVNDVVSANLAMEDKAIRSVASAKASQKAFDASKDAQ